MQINTFDELYKQLNEQQRNAVDTVEGPVMVIAGPGTGKTQILTLRIANILKQTQIEPENILALTFTESGVASMRKRLISIIGSSAYRVNISTFHGFANEIIKEYPEYFPHIIGADNATDMDQIQAMENVIISNKLKELKPFGDPLHYLKPALNAISDLKREGVTPEQLEDLVIKDEEELGKIDDLYYDKGTHKGKMKGKYQDQARHITKNKELVIVYKAYQAQFIERQLYDYEDMIVETLKALQSNSDLLITLQERYHYFLVDEHQDTNNAQNRILELLASFHDNPNVFIVGDEKQAIFRFQGASLENFHYFKNLYKSAKLINLEQNYRSTQNILDASHEVMTHLNPIRLQKTQNHKEEQIHIRQYSTQDVEYYALAKDIEQKIKDGIDPDSIAILYRQNKDAGPISYILSKFGVPYSIESDQNILENLSIRKLIQLLRAIAQYGQAIPLIEVLHIDFLNIDPLQVYAIAQSKTDPYKQIEQNEATKAFADQLLKWHKIEHNDTALVAFESVVRDSGLLDYLAKTSKMGDLEKISILFSQLRILVDNHSNYTINDFVKHIDILIEHQIPIKSNHRLNTNDKIHLMTAHRAKGLEFDYVYIIGVVDKYWGNRRQFSNFKLPSSVYTLNSGITSEDKFDSDERNLFYVALTRARKVVYISYSQSRSDGREQLPAQFVTEIKPELIIYEVTDEEESMFNEHTSILFEESKINNEADDISKAYISELLSKRGFAVTHLNNYLQCPWKYFYVNLLRVPMAPAKSQIYGMAIHASLKDYFDHFKEGDLGANYMIDKFIKHLSNQPLTDRDKDELIQKGTQALTGYYDTYSKTWHKDVLNEFKVKGVELHENLRLTGVIDKMELLGGSTTKLQGVRVIDYKTSKPKTARYIKGETKDSNRDYYRQLVFYKLLLNEFDEGKYKMKLGEIDFVESNPSGKYKKESFEISDDEVKDLRKQILEVADEIVELKFWNRRCKDEECKWCRLREMMS